MSIGLLDVFVCLLFLLTHTPDVLIVLADCAILPLYYMFPVYVFPNCIFMSYNLMLNLHSLHFVVRDTRISVLFTFFSPPTVSSV